MATQTPALAITLGCAAAVAIVLGFMSWQRLAEYDDELVLWEGAMEFQPNNPLVDVNVGIILKNAGRTEQAVEFFKRALVVKPDLFEAHFNLAKVYDEAGQTEDAIAEYRRTIELTHVLPEAHNNLGLLLANSGSIDEAIEQYERTCN